MGISISASTVHRRLQEFAVSHEPFGTIDERAYRYLVVDGTKVRLQQGHGQDLGQVEMRWTLGSVGPGEKFEPVGFWIDMGRGEIRKPLESQLDCSRQEVFFVTVGGSFRISCLPMDLRRSSRPSW